MESCMRPNRSDVHLSREDEANIEEATREYFGELAPKRHTKPQRSEYSSTYADAFSNANRNGEIPEFSEFQRLEKDTQKLVYNGSNVSEEFMETEYYKDLNCIDKQHHTTGTGFIKMENKGGSLSLTPDTVTEYHAATTGNPATNDWIPAPADKVNFASGKPRRSEN